MLFNLLNIKLSRKLKQLDEIPWINCGGCAIVSLALLEYLNNNYPKKNAEIMYLFGHGNEENYRNLSNNNHGSCSHAVIKIGNKYIDSTGCYTLSQLKDSWDIEHTLIISKELALLSLQASSWNPMFNRIIGVPKINEILNVAIAV